MGHSSNSSYEFQLLRTQCHMNITLCSGFPEDAGSVKCAMVFHPSHGCTAGGILGLQLPARTRSRLKPLLQPPVHLLQKVRGDALVDKVVVEPQTS